MIRRIAAVVLTFLSMLVPATAADYSFINGFAGYPWGTDFRAVSFIELSQREKPSEYPGGVVFYPCSLRTYAGCAIRDCRLSFKGGGLWSFEFHLVDPGQKDAVLAALRQSFGHAEAKTIGSGATATYIYSFDADSTYSSVWYDRSSGDVKVSAGPSISLDFTAAVKRAARLFAQPGPKIADGFRGFAWGSTRAEISFVGQKVEDDGNGCLTYLGKIDSVGGVKIDTCLLGFYKDQLFQVILTIKSFQAFKNMLASMTAAYGEPTKPNPYIDDYVWFGDVTTRGLKYLSIRDYALAFMWSNSISEQRDADLASRAKERSRDF